MRAPSPSAWVRIHGSLALIWVALAVPAVLLWRDSVPFLVFISVYANFAGSVASWQSARADCNSPTVEAVESVNERLIVLLRRIPE